MSKRRCVRSRVLFPPYEPGEVGEGTKEDPIRFVVWDGNGDLTAVAMSPYLAAKIAELLDREANLKTP